MITAEEEAASYQVKAVNDDSERQFGSLDVNLRVMGRGQMHRAAGQASCQINGDYYSNMDVLVTGRRSKMKIEMDKKGEEAESSEMGIVHQLCTRLQDSLLATSKRGAAAYDADKGAAIRRQRARRADKKKAIANKQRTKSKKDFKEATWLLQQFSSPRFCRTRADLFRAFNLCKNQTQRYLFIKEQILICLLGVGIEAAYTPWSVDGYTFTPEELLKHQSEVVLPLLRGFKPPAEAPIHVARLPVFGNLGTRSCIVDEYYAKAEEALDKEKVDVLRERDKEELEGEHDQYEYMQPFHWPGKSLKKKYKMEKLFRYTDKETGEVDMIWCNGIVTKVLQSNDDVVKAEIKWDAKYVDAGESGKSVEKLIRTKFNPKKPGLGAWRQDLRHLQLKSVQ